MGLTVKELKEILEVMDESLPVEIGSWVYLPEGSRRSLFQKAVGVRKHQSSVAIMSKP